MKKVMVLSLFAATFAIPALADTISIRADMWAPYNAQPNSKAPGYMIEIAKLIFEELGHKVDYDLLPWARAIDETRGGKHTAIVGATKEEVPEFVFPQNEQGKAPIATFFVRKGNDWKFTGVGSLKSQSFGTIKGYSYGEELDAYIQKNPSAVQELTGESALEQNIKKVLSNRVIDPAGRRLHAAYLTRGSWK